MEIYQAPSNLSFREKIIFLLKPTAEWGPAGQPIWIPPNRSGMTSNYSSVTNTMVLVNGMPVDSLASDTDVMQL